MNLVTCSKNCIHQCDGYCQLENSFYISQHKVDGCCYFQSIAQNQPVKSNQEVKHWTTGYYK